MLLPYTQRINDPKNFDYQLAQMINEPYTDMKVDIDLHDQENAIVYDRDTLKNAKFVSGPHFWNAPDGKSYVTLMFDVRVQFPNRVKSRGRVIVTD